MAFYSSNKYLGEILFSDKFSPDFIWSSDSGSIKGKEGIYFLNPSMFLLFHCILLQLTAVHNIDA